MFGAQLLGVDSLATAGGLTLLVPRPLAIGLWLVRTWVISINDPKKLYALARADNGSLRLAHDPWVTAKVFAQA